MKWTVRSISRDVSQERLSILGRLRNKSVCLFEKYVGTKTLSRYNFSVVKIPSIKIRIIPDIWGLAHSTSAMAIDLIKASIFRAVRKIVSEMPLSKHSSFITRSLKKLSQRALVFPKHRSSHYRVPGTGTVRPVTRHQGSSGWRAGGSNMIIRQPDRFIGKLIDGWCLNDWISSASKISIPLIIGNDDDYIGAFTPKAKKRQR